MSLSWLSILFWDTLTPSPCSSVVVLWCVTVSSEALNLSDLLERVSMASDKLHSLSTSLTSDVGSQLPPIFKIMRPSQCHTSSLQTPTDKEQALNVPEEELLSLARSLLLSWSDPLAVLLAEAHNLVHPDKSAILSKTKDLHLHSSSLGAGLEHLIHKMGAQSQGIISLPYNGDVGTDKNASLSNFYFLLTCFRRDSHKIDSFLKVLRCRASKRPEMC
ncbi:hypothetical protein ACEWY4_002893 [Coilia grayii]|uniref:Prolactin n=1 Tax=Coilia grayii TaxID=363190 RepID=A0ABD1KPQ8_9TELE